MRERARSWRKNDINQMSEASGQPAIPYIYVHTCIRNRGLVVVVVVTRDNARIHTYKGERAQAAPVHSVSPKRRRRERAFLSRALLLCARSGTMIDRRPAFAFLEEQGEGEDLFPPSGMPGREAGKNGRRKKLKEESCGRGRVKSVCGCGFWSVDFEYIFY